VGGRRRGGGAARADGVVGAGGASARGQQGMRVRAARGQQGDERTAEGRKDSRRTKGQQGDERDRAARGSGLRGAPADRERKAGDGERG